MDEGRQAQLVQPFYLKLMRTNALENGTLLLPAIGDLGRQATPTEIVALLRDSWRPRVMGAWYALLHDDETVTDAVLSALASSFGSLDSPPLATAAVVLAGPRALPALEIYASNDISAKWGACGFAAAAIEHLGATTTACPALDRDRLEFTGLLALADSLRATR